MPLLSEIAQKKKIDFFIRPISKDARILEIGSGDGWLCRYLQENGYQSIGIDIIPPADIVGDIRNWQTLGLKPESFDYLIAFEVVEHVHFWQEAYDLLKPGGKLLLTSPVPRMDWFLKLLERAGLNQKRTSPHTHLITFSDIPLFEPAILKTVGGLSQWGVFQKPNTHAL